MQSIDAPLGLINVLTVLCALACLWVVSPEQRGPTIRTWALVVPGACASVVALILLAGVFEATAIHDAEWLAALSLGAFIGRARGWTLPVAISESVGLIRFRPCWDGVFVAAGIAVTAIVDFVNASIEQPVFHPAHVAAAAAFCAGFLSCRALALLVRAGRMVATGASGLR